MRKEEMVGSWWMVAMASKKRIVMFWYAEKTLQAAIVKKGKFYALEADKT